MSKYGNKKTIVRGIPFDSRAEGARYQELKLLEKAGEIRDLQLQPKFELIPKQPGERAVTYTADFMYEEKAPAEWVLIWRTIVEDVKGVKTKDYVIRRKLFKFRFPGIEFREV